MARSHFTIGVIGANGVVGSEVCLFLRQMDDITPVPICRTKISSAFLRRAGMDCRHGSLADPPIARGLLADCDLVVDFSLPRGLPSQFRESARELIKSVIQHSRRSVPFIYISSTMALGMPSQGGALERYAFARTAYGTLKRYSERLAIRAGKQFGNPVYVLRLGHVHGELQPVSRYIVKTLRRERAYIPAGCSHSVFPYTIAEALADIARGKHVPGTYTLVSQPQWTWKELHEFYCWRAGISADFVEVPPLNNGHHRSWPEGFRSLVKRLISPQTVELAKGYALWRTPQLERRAMAFFFKYQSESEIRSGQLETRYTPYASFDSFVGVMPGKRLNGLSDTRPLLKRLSLQIRQIVAAASAEPEAELAAGKLESA